MSFVKFWRSCLKIYIFALFDRDKHYIKLLVFKKRKVKVNMPVELQEKHLREKNNKVCALQKFNHLKEKKNIKTLRIQN